MYQPMYFIYKYKVLLLVFVQMQEISKERHFKS